ncbi:MAG TPA: 16S rRNA (adenine(1518)-N(6)/adenine(1519)-N(6))-dimethyltransferase RsmA [Chlamydiales bacterium]|nr:16S rRNA (adenine(1518)-N(6)/adenine(1519)-N(6))-dimethyltransferase RsmA [Chlamydiales bacterium]
MDRIGARPKKHLSQNFLIDPSTIRKILDLAQVRPGDHVLEIGPGPGALTTALLEAGAHVHAVEIDTAFATELHRIQSDQLTVYEADFLTFPMKRLPAHFKVVANLPYHITSPILEKLFATPFTSLTLMVQKEVATRMASPPGTKDFGSLSLFVQFYSHLHSSFTVPAHCFYPRPQVDSTVIRLDTRTLPPVDPLHFFSLVHKAFQHRRKMLTSSLALPKDQVRQALTTLGIRPDARPEALSLDQWVALTIALIDNGKTVA